MLMVHDLVEEVHANVAMKVELLVELLAAYFALVAQLGRRRHRLALRTRHVLAVLLFCRGRCC